MTEPQPDELDAETHRRLAAAYFNAVIGPPRRQGRRPGMAAVFRRLGS